MVREYGGKFLRKNMFFWDPLVVPFLLEHIFGDPQKSSMIFYRKVLAAKIMSRTHNYVIPKTPEIAARTRTHIDFKMFPIC